MKYTERVQCDKCSCTLEQGGQIVKAYNVMENYHVNHFVRKHICNDCQESIKQLGGEDFTIVIKVSMPGHEVVVK